MHETDFREVMEFLRRDKQDREQFQTAITDNVNMLHMRINRMSGTLSTDITALQQQVTASSTVEESAVTLISGLATQLQTALTAAQNAGATPDELSALTAMQTSLQSSSSDLANAITANTPASATPPTPPAPAPTAPVVPGTGATVTAVS